MDAFFYTLTIICILIFSGEITLTYFQDKDYRLNFYFWSDIVITLTLFFFDIGWLFYAMIDVSKADYSNATGAYAYALRDEGVKEGTRVARVARVIRLVRLTRIIKMYRHAHAFITHKTLKKDETLKQRTERKLKGQQEESQVGKKLSDLTTRRVIVLVTLMLLLVPLFTINTYKEENQYFEYGLDIVGNFSNNMNSTAYQTIYQSYIDEHKDIPMPITNLIVVNGMTNMWNDPDIDLDKFRPYEKELVIVSDDKVCGVFDFRFTTRLTAALGIIRSFFVCAVLTLGAVFFSRDATFLVIRPIENMISKVNRIAKNPLEAAQEEENETLAYERAMARESKKLKGKKKKTKEQDYETVKIEQTIVKIGSLLALGFGEAGAKIIAQNMGRGGDVDPMVPGNKVVAIFGFCDIRNFSDITEVLQEDIMMFVNEIADIVHGEVDKFSGAPNKNIGDVFLLVWKFNNEDVDKVEQEGNPGEYDLVTKNNNRVAQTADMAVVSFIKIIAEIRKSHRLDRYSQNKEILAKLPNYKVQLGFGLHVGWAIEGAIGSDFKIDASYLSPNVNMASRLDAATKQFGVPLLISGSVKNICTPRTQTNLRILDIVTVKGSIEPVQMVTCDLDTTVIKVEQPQKKQRSRRQDKKMKKVRGRIQRNRYKQAAMSNQIQVSEKFELDEDIKNMRAKYTKEFYDVFKLGFEYYINGDWEVARDHLQGIEGNIIDVDIPTKLILKNMAEYNYKAPDSWRGYRVLTDK